MSQFFDLSNRLKLRVTGADAERFLNGQLTNDVRKATETAAIQACVLNNKGKLNAHLFLTEDNDGFLIDADSTLRDALQPRLDRYIIADDVQIEDVTNLFALFHLLGELPPDFPSELKFRSSNRFAKDGADLWIPAEQHNELRQKLSHQFCFCDGDCAEKLRIERGIPRWGRELTDEIIPVEANLESQAIDYEKGCYIGQEVISRMKMSGQTNKRLCGLIGESLQIGMKLFPLEAGAIDLNRPLDERKDAGWITSVADIKGQRLGLGFVRRGFNSPGIKLRSTGAAAPETPGPVDVVELPFRL